MRLSLLSEEEQRAHVAAGDAYFRPVTQVQLLSYQWTFRGDSSQHTVESRVPSIVYRMGQAPVPPPFPCF